MATVRLPILDAQDRVAQVNLPAHLTTTALTEAAQDATAALMQAGAGITLTYNDASNTLTITATGGGGTLDAEAVRDTIAAALVGSGLITVTANDAADTITVATAATQNASDAQLRDRATHTGQQTTATIQNFSKAVQDLVGAMVLAGTGIGKTYDAAAGTLTLTSTGGGTGGATDPEVVRDTMAAALVAGARITLTTDDTADTITVATTATVNSTDAQLRDRATHTGTQTAATISDFVEAAQDAVASSLAAAGLITINYDDTANTLTITTTATANSSDAQLRDRSTHTGTQLASTISDFAAAVQAQIGAHTHTLSQISDMTTFSRLLAGSVDATQARATLGISAVAPFARAVYSTTAGWPVRPNAVAVDYLGGTLADPPLDAVEGTDTWTLPATAVT